MKLTLFCVLLTSLAVMLNNGAMVTAAWWSISGNSATNAEPTEDANVAGSGDSSTTIAPPEVEPAVIDDNAINEASGEPMADTKSANDTDNSEPNVINVLDNSHDRFASKRTNCPNAFRCDNGRCVPGYYRCDMYDDCMDGSDEADCDQVVCAVNQYRCASGMCIPTVQKCDGQRDCPHGDDEEGC